jgi:predicted Zn-dependent peptidase
MILVGDLEPDKLIKLVKKYFESIPRGTVEPPDVITLEEKQYGEKRMLTDAETNPQAELWYHTVAWKHPDSYALEVLAGVMNGKTGRLYKKLVDEKNIALGTSSGGGMMGYGGGLRVGAGQNSNKYAGSFAISAEGKGETKPAQLEAAMYEVLDDLQKNPITEKELQKVKNQYMVDNIRFMDIMSGIGILFYLGSNAAYGDWTEANNGPARIQQVMADDVMRVANKYFEPKQRNVLLIDTKKVYAPGEEPPMDPQMAQMVQMIKGMNDAAKLEQMIGMFSMQLDSVEDPDERTQMEQLLQIAKDHLATLKAAEEGK